PHLCSALQYLELVRLAQEGTRRMAQEMVRLSLPEPRIEEISDSRVRVTLYNAIERRRTRVDADAIRKQWSTVSQGLRDNLAIYRQQAAREWQQLSQKGATPPEDVVDAALRILRDAGTPEDAPEARILLGLLEPTYVERWAVTIAEDLLAGRYRVKNTRQYL